MAKRKVKPKSVGVTSTTSTTSSKATVTPRTQTAPRDVVYPKNAPPNSDIKDIRSRLDVDTNRFVSADSIEKVVQISEDILRYWVRYRDCPESTQFFAEVRPWMIHLCTGHPEIPTPPSESDPLAWMKWFADTKRVIEGKTNGTADAYIPFTKAIELSNGVLNRKKLEKAINEGLPVEVRDRKPSKQRREVQLTDTEQNILQALGDAHMTGPVLLKKAGYDNSSHYRQILSNLRKRDILDHDGMGYVRRDA